MVVGLRHLTPSSSARVVRRPARRRFRLGKGSTTAVDTVRAVTTVGAEEARRIAVRAQLLDGSARGVLETVRQLGFLQLDPISTVAPPQHLVLWSRLGSRTTPPSSTGCSGRRRSSSSGTRSSGRSRRCRCSGRACGAPARDAVQAASAGGASSCARTRVQALHPRELERRGPLLSRELEDRSVAGRREHRWYGSRQVGSCSRSLHGAARSRSSAAAAGSASGISPSAGSRRRRPCPRARRSAARGAAVPRARRPAREGQVGGPSRRERRPGADRVTLLSPFDRLDPRPRPRRGALRLPLPARDVRPAREARVRLLRAAAPRRRPARRAARSRGSTARRRRSSCSAPGATHRASTRRWTSSGSFSAPRAPSRNHPSNRLLLSRGERDA